MWFEFFVFGGILFWGLLLIELILLTALVEAEEGWWSFWSVVIFISLIHLFGDVNVFTYIKMHTGDFFRWIVLYIIVGVLWGFGKFYFYNSSAKRAIETCKPKFMEHAVQYRDEEHMDYEWRAYLRDNLTSRQFECLELNKQAHKVIIWISYWPVSFFWTILNDPLRRFGNWMYYTFLIRIFKRIHQSTVGNAFNLDKNNVKFTNRDKKE